MFGQQSTFVSMVRCLAFVVLFQFGALLSGAQTPRPPMEKSSEEPIALKQTSPPLLLLKKQNQRLRLTNQRLTLSQKLKPKTPPLRHKRSANVC
jgi:hypothetical protein